MIIRNCAGGLVFCGNSVLLIRNDKHEWSFPKGVVRSGEKLIDVAKSRVKIETDVDVTIVAPCGKTNYEFYSISRMKPVHNNVSWFVMKALDYDCKANNDEGVLECKYYPIDEALEMITYSQDKALLMMGYQKYKEKA